MGHVELGRRSSCAWLRPAPHMGAEAGPSPESKHVGCSPWCRAPKERLGYPTAAGLGVCDHVCERIRMETWNPGTSVLRLGVTRQEMCSLPLCGDVPWTLEHW